ncbi:MAG: hypothetical protein J7483_02590 [Novosphingobium sp.]|nr:hypothetical protein [Novosphingobium sp.]
MALTYRVRRPLPGEARIDTRRDYEIRFEPVGRAWRVQGRQVSSAIDGPPELAPLAEVWRKTELAGLFPFMLDEGGRVIAGSGPLPAPVPGLADAIDIALAMLRDSGSSEATIADAHQFGLWLQRAAGEIGSSLPPNLFVPPALPERASRAIELPGGGSGTIEVRFEGMLSPDTGLMCEARREVVTTVEGSAQSMVEAWSLARS